MPISLLIAALAVAWLTPPQAAGLDSDGFIRNWVVLAPIPIEGDSGAGEIDHEFIKPEGAITPKSGEQVKVDLDMKTWTAHQAPDYYIDFLQAFGKSRGEYVAAYAVAYVIADADTTATLALSTNDQGKAWLNGKPVFKFAETRTLEKDSDKVDVTLVKGQNVLVLKVVNEVNNWQACARFLKDGAPLTGLKIANAPQ
jgi:hypothetical protein